MAHRTSLRNYRRWVISGVVAVVIAAGMMVTLLAGGEKDEAGVATAATAPVASPRYTTASASWQQPLVAAPGQYRYVTRELSPEVTTKAGDALVAARLGEARTWQLDIDANGDWVERSTDDDVAITRSYQAGMHRTTVDGDLQEPRIRSDMEDEYERAARQMGSSFAAGGPRIEFNPYGASFILYVESTQNDSAIEDGRAARLSEKHVSCGTSTCVRVDVEREVLKPAEGAEVYRSLPWDASNTERSILIYEPMSQLVYKYETSFNGTVLHSFELLDQPEA